MYFAYMVCKKTLWDSAQNSGGRPTCQRYNHVLFFKFGDDRFKRLDRQVLPFPIDFDGIVFTALGV